MKQCDFVIDMPTNHWCYTEAYNEVLDAGTKMILTSEDEELLYRLSPRKEFMERTRRAAKILTDSSAFRIKSDAGTDLAMCIKGRTCYAQSGAVDDEFRWDNFPSGLTGIAPIEDSLNGTMVIVPGDPVVGLGCRMTEKIICTFQDGKLTKIQGGIEAYYLEEWFDQWNDPRVRTVAHTGFGTDPRAILTSGEAMDWESYEDGKNKAAAHLDIILLNASCWLNSTEYLRNTWKKGDRK